MNSRSKDKTKRLFKFAYINQPQSIRSLKRSLSISYANIQTFAKSIGDFTNLRGPKESVFNEHIEDNELIEEVAQEGITEVTKNFTKMSLQRKQIAHQLAMNRIKGQTGHIRPNCKLISKSFKLQTVSHKNQLLTGQNTKKKIQQLHCSQYQFVLPKSVQNSMNSTKRQYWHINEPKNRNLKANTNKYKSENSQTQRNSFNTQRIFCFSREKANQTRVLHHKTEPNQKSAEKSLGYLTHYDNSKNNKALNCLVLQLQLNLQIQKKVKNKTLN